MQALILAAGRGSRMGSKTSEVPKCLLEIGGKPLIEHMLEGLAESGVGPVGIVVGYEADEIRDVVGIRADFIENSRWSRTNSLYSFWLARDWVEGPVMVLNSDLLLDPRILERMAATDENALAYDSASGDGAEQMKVEIADHALVNMSKRLPESEVSGENLGVLAFTARGVRRLFQIAEAAIEDGAENDWLGRAVSELALESPIRAVDVADLPWCEIDFSYDLDRARKQVWPRIRRRAPRRLLDLLVRAAAAVGIAASVFLLVTVLFVRRAPASWETLELSTLSLVQIESGDRKQRWWRLDTGAVFEFHVTGPTSVKFSSRPILAGADDTMRYALEVELNGEPVSWDDHLGSASATWQAPSGTIGKRDDFELDLPEIESHVRVRLVSAEPGAVLVRVFQGFDETIPD